MGGTPLPPFTDFSLKIFLQKRLKIVFFAQETPVFGKKKRVTDLGGTPLPPFKDKIRKVVFDGFPKALAFFTLTYPTFSILKKKIISPSIFSNKI